MQSSRPLVLALALLAACAETPLVQTPPVIRVLTKQAVASDSLGSGEPLSSGRLIADVGLLDAVIRVSSRLVAAAQRSQDYGAHARALNWIIAVYDEPQLRVSVGADGRIVLSRRTFDVAETEAGLAAIVSHELVRALTADSASASSGSLKTPEEQRPLATREDELQLDNAGLALMAAAGYDPRELLKLWQRMKPRQEGTGHELDVHVNYDRRIEHLLESLPNALVRYERANRAPQKALRPKQSRLPGAAAG